MFTHSLEFLLPRCLWPPSIPLLLALDLAAGWRHGRLLWAGCGQLATDGHQSWPRLLLLLTASCRWLLNTYSTHIPTSNKHTRHISTLPLLYYFLRCDGIFSSLGTPTLCGKSLFRILCLVLFQPKLSMILICSIVKIWGSYNYTDTFSIRINLNIFVMS